MVWTGCTALHIFSRVMSRQAGLAGTAALIQAPNSVFLCFLQDALTMPSATEPEASVSSTQTSSTTKHPKMPWSALALRFMVLPRSTTGVATLESAHRINIYQISTT